MKPLPKKIFKSKMVELYADQFPTKRILEELKSFQEQLNIPVKRRILSNNVKNLFFQKFGLPTGYVFDEQNTSLPYNNELKTQKEAML